MLSLGNRKGKADKARRFKARTRRSAGCEKSQKTCLPKGKRYHPPLPCHGPHATVLFGLPRRRGMVALDRCGNLDHAKIFVRCFDDLAKAATRCMPCLQHAIRGLCSSNSQGVHHEDSHTASFCRLGFSEVRHVCAFYCYAWSSAGRQEARSLIGGNRNAP